MAGVLRYASSMVWCGLPALDVSAIETGSVRSKVGLVPITSPRLRHKISSAAGLQCIIRPFLARTNTALGAFVESLAAFPGLASARRKLTSVEIRSLLDISNSRALIKYNPPIARFTRSSSRRRGAEELHMPRFLTIAND